MGWADIVLSRCFTIGIILGTVLFSEDVSSEAPGPIISTKAGSFQGLKIIPPGQERAVYAFLGIPYAEPPIGTERFNKPKSINFIPGIFKATEKPPSCFQLDSDFHLPWFDKHSSMSEDCLYLNLWAPERRTTEEGLKPVMVWLHGGGFTVGSSAMDLYDGQVLSALGEVVVVTLNYRLAAFGFLNTLTNDAPGNAGLFDQLLVLHWVKTNIEYFGGDPKRVTLFGESAGAMSAGLLALSPLSRGLIQRLILQSGSSYFPYSQNPYHAVERGNRLANAIGCANDTFTLLSHPKEVVNCLRGLPAAELTKSYFEQHDSVQESLNTFYRPQSWDELIPKHPIDIFRSRNYTTYDLFAGLTQSEGSSLFVYAFPEAYQLYTEGKLIINKTLAANMLSGFFKAVYISHPQKIIDYYLKDTAEDQQSIITAIYEAVGDYFVACPVVYLGEKYSERSVPIQFYRFDHRPSTSPWPEWMGAAHFDEVQFVFGMPIRYPEEYQEGEKELSEYIIRTWTNFAKSENLTLKNGLPWPIYLHNNTEYATLETGQQKTGSGERKKQCDFWRPYFDAE